MQGVFSFEFPIFSDEQIYRKIKNVKTLLTCVLNGSTGEIKKGYFTIEAAVLSEGKKMPMSVYEKVFSAAEEVFISETHENLYCLKSLSEHFSKTCVHTLDRRFDANEYYRYFLRNNEKFVIRAKKNRNVITNLICYNIAVQSIIQWIKRKYHMQGQNTTFNMASFDIYLDKMWYTHVERYNLIKCCLPI